MSNEHQMKTKCRWNRWNVILIMRMAVNHFDGNAALCLLTVTSTVVGAPSIHSTTKTAVNSTITFSTWVSSVLLQFICAGTAIQTEGNHKTTTVATIGALVPHEPDYTPDLWLSLVMNEHHQRYHPQTENYQIYYFLLLLLFPVRMRNTGGEFVYEDWQRRIKINIFSATATIQRTASV